MEDIWYRLLYFVMYGKKFSTKEIVVICISEGLHLSIKEFFNCIFGKTW